MRTSYHKRIISHLVSHFKAPHEWIPTLHEHFFMSQGFPLMIGSPVLRIPDTLKLYLFTDSSVGRKEITINKKGGLYEPPVIPVKPDLTRTQSFLRYILQFDRLF